MGKVLLSLGLLAGALACTGARAASLTSIEAGIQICREAQFREIPTAVSEGVSVDDYDAYVGRKVQTMQALGLSNGDRQLVEIMCKAYLTGTVDSTNRALGIARRAVESGSVVVAQAER